jgi:hypothetical protein
MNGWTSPREPIVSIRICILGGDFRLRTNGTNVGRLINVSVLAGDGSAHITALPFWVAEVVSVTGVFASTFRTSSLLDCLRSSTLALSVFGVSVDVCGLDVSTRVSVDAADEDCGTGNQYSCRAANRGFGAGSLATFVHF